MAEDNRRSVDWPIILFFALAYAIAWGAVGLLSLIARQSSGVESGIDLLAMGEVMQFEGADLSVPGFVIYLITRLADFSFSIAGVIMIAVTAGMPGLRRLGRRLVRWQFHWKWTLAALIPLGLFILSVLVAGLTDDGIFPSLDMSGAAWRAALFSLNGGLLVSIFLRGAMGEELGLRGFAVPRLQSRHSPHTASAIVGALWALWHLPVLIGRDPVSLIFFLLIAFGLGFVFTWLFNGSGGSLIPVLLFHGIQNAEEVYEFLFPGLIGTDWEIISSLGLLVTAIIVAIFLRGVPPVTDTDPA